VAEGPIVRPIVLWDAERQPGEVPVIHQARPFMNPSSYRTLGHLLRSLALFWLPFLLATATVLAAQDLLRTQLAMQVLAGLQSMLPTHLTFATTLLRNIQATAVVVGAAAVLPARLRWLRPAGWAVAAVLAFNGVVVGVFLGAASVFAGVSAWTLFLSGVAPHGVLEVPALLITAVLAWSLADAKQREQPGWGVPTRLFVLPIRMYVVAVLPLLAGAAYIENRYTDQLLSLVLRQLGG